MNLEVIKHVGLEMLCSTEIIPDNSIFCVNSFKYEF